MRSLMSASCCTAILALVGAAGAATTTTRPSTTTTTNAPESGSCPSITACESALMASLPAPTAATSGKAKKTAAHLRHLAVLASHELDRATAATGSHRTRLLKRAHKALARLRTEADKAATRGTLGVPVASIDADIAGLLALAGA